MGLISDEKGDDKENYMKEYKTLIFEVRVFEEDEIWCDIVTASNPNDNDYGDIDWE